MAGELLDKAKVLLTYYRSYQLDTSMALINQWAPPTENDTMSYAQQIAKALGVAHGERINLERPDTLEIVVATIIQHENGQQPYDAALIV